MFDNESGDVVATDNNSNEVINNNEALQAETEKVEEVAAGEPAETQEEEDNTEGEVRRTRPGGFRRKLTRLERENAELTARLAELAAPAKQGTDERPIIDNYSTYDDYTEALTEWKVDQKLNNREVEAKKIEEAKQEKAINQSWQDKIDALPEACDDYEEVVGSAFNGVSLNKTVIEAAYEAGPEVIYHISNNKELANKIRTLSPSQAIREIVKIETQLSQKPTVKVSKSSEPINPLKGGVKTAVKLENLDTDSYIAQRHPHLLKKK